MTPEIKKLFMNILKQYVQHNNIKSIEGETDAKTMQERYKNNVVTYLTRVQEVVNADVEAASFGLKPKRMTQLQKTAFNTSLTHGLMKFAEFVVTGRETLQEIK